MGTKDDGDEIESIVLFGIAKTSITDWPEICVNLRLDSLQLPILAFTAEVSPFFQDFMLVNSSIVIGYEKIPAVNSSLSLKTELV